MPEYVRTTRPVSCCSPVFGCRRFDAVVRPEIEGLSEIAKWANLSETIVINITLNFAGQRRRLKNVLDGLDCF